MRDYYRKKLRELEKIRSGQLDKKFKKWNLFDKLDFLRPFLRHIELDNTSTPADSHTGSRNESDIDSEEEGVHLGIVKTENTDEDEEDNQSDDSYRREVIQALDSGYGSVEQSAGGKKSSKNTNHLRGRSIRRRAAYLDRDNPPSKSATKRQRSAERTSPAPVKPVRLSPVTVEDLLGEVSTNQHFFASLVPMIQTLDPITAMEFRHEVHGVLLRYLKEERDKQKAKSQLATTSSASLFEQNDSGHAIPHGSLEDGSIKNQNNDNSVGDAHS